MAGWHWAGDRHRGLSRPSIEQNPEPLHRGTSAFPHRASGSTIGSITNNHAANLAIQGRNPTWRLAPHAETLTPNRLFGGRGCRQRPGGRLAGLARSPRRIARFSSAGYSV